MPASPNPVVGLRSVSYLCGGLASRFLFSSSVFLLAGNMEKPTTTHQPTTGQSLTAKHYEGIVLHGPLQAGGVENISGDQHRTTARQARECVARLAQGGMQGEPKRREA